MDIIISNASGKPIYEQITVQIKSQILSGALTAGDALPSMRTLAKELRISVITTKRAYEDLERDGFIETVAGKGSFVASKTQNSCAKKRCGGWRLPYSRLWTPRRAAAYRRRSCARCWNFYWREIRI